MLLWTTLDDELHLVDAFDLGDGSCHTFCDLILEPDERERDEDDESGPGPAIYIRPPEGKVCGKCQSELAAEVEAAQRGQGPTIVAPDGKTVLPIDQVLQQLDPRTLKKRKP